MMMRLPQFLTTAGLVLGLATAGAQAQDYPARDVTNVVVWAAGGGTDTLNRLIMAEMQDDLGANINVTNRTGGVGGSAGMSFVYSQPADGYTLAGISESVVTAGVQGGWEQRMDVWYPFIVGGSPDLISVPADSPHQSIEDLVQAAKDNPGSIQAGASAAGSIHHLNLLAFGEGAGVEFNFIPYDGSAPAQNAAVAGEVQMVVTSLAEQAQLIQAGRLRPLATLVPESVEMEGVGAIPSAFDTWPELSNHLPIQQAIGFAVRADAPEEVKRKLTEAFDAAMESDAVKQWAEENHYTLSGLSGDEASEEFARLESLFAWTLHELGAASVDPATLGIPKPE